MLGLAVALLVLGAWACGSEPFSPPPARKRPEHPPDGTPPNEETDQTGEPPAPGTEPSPVQQAEERFGPSLDLFVRAKKEGRHGCAILRFDDLRFTNQNGSRATAISGIARWASTPPFFPGAEPAASEIAYRSGDFPISWVTDEYPEYGSVGLKYLVSGSYDPGSRRLELQLKNIDAESGQPTEIFLSPVYESWTDPAGEAVDCIAQSDFTNEFFVAAPSTAVTINAAGPGAGGAVCETCPEPLQSLRLELK